MQEIRSNVLKIGTAVFVALAVCLSAYAVKEGSEQNGESASPRPSKVSTDVAIATFAGGCFWCMEHPFDVVDGVISTVSGYTGGHIPNPSYQQVSAGGTGHAEAVQISYDPTKVSYEQLLRVFWRNIDPTDRNGQFCDHGNQYRSAIFYHDHEQEALAGAQKSSLEKNKPFAGEIVTEVVAASAFYPAEAYHQDYYIKNPLKYKFYRYNCGRDKRLGELWGE